MHSKTPPQLPPPSHDALIASHELTQSIIDAIRREGNAIPFSKFMEMVLYQPTLGYYTGGSVKLGQDGDFTTAPEISPLFGATLANFAQRLFPSQSFEILELGAGSGKLAYDFLTECKTQHIAITQYCILDLSGELRARQQSLLHSFPQVRWLDTMPDKFNGLLLANEVLDAMPVELVQKTESGWQQLYVAVDESGQQGFTWQHKPAALDLITQIPEAESLPIGYLTEVHPQARGFVASLVELFLKSYANRRGAYALFLDYGFPASEFYHPQRTQGTLMCHYRHHSHPDPFFLPGLQDVTAHVDFTDIARTALEAGYGVHYYGSQAGFLLDSGMSEILQRISSEEALKYLPQARAMQKLISPAEMGEIFKVILLGHPDVSSIEMRSDQSYRL